VPDPRRPADDGEEFDREPPVPAGMPRWVKVGGGITIAILLVAVLAMLVLGGDHGPGRHGAEPAGDKTAACGNGC
jgi:hypothetical protein